MIKSVPAALTVDQAKTVFRQKLAKLMRDRGMRPAELARLSGVSKSSISGYQGGRSLPDAVSMAAIERALELGVGELLPDYDLKGKTAPAAGQAYSMTPVADRPGWSLLTLRVEVPVRTATAIINLILDAEDNAADGD